VLRGIQVQTDRQLDSSVAETEMEGYESDSRHWLRAF